jgi:uncharacterized membrane protein
MDILSSIVAQNSMFFWETTLFYLFLFVLIGGIISVRYLTKQLNKRNEEIKNIQQQHTAKIDLIRKDHSEILDGLRSEMLKKEEERTRQWIESEKETLHVLNGVSSLLELSENIGRVESEKILSKLEEIKGIIEKKVNGHD